MKDTDITTAVAFLKQGGVIAYPTEGVFGLSCDASNLSAVQRVIQLKGRPLHKGLILIASAWDQLQPYVKKLTDEQMAIIMATWPGPVTWLVPAAESTSSLLTGDHTTIAVRITAHPIARELCEIFGKALVSTSANRNTLTPCTTAEEVSAIFEDELDFILEGATGGLTGPTTIRDLLTGKVLR
jgi:L-threonylcarbamoyladenylate synthase